jgi:hypothetical protein
MLVQGNTIDLSLFVPYFDERVFILNDHSSCVQF